MPKSSKQSPRKTYAFVGDGETEQWYLQMLKKMRQS